MKINGLLIYSYPLKCKIDKYCKYTTRFHY